MDTRNILDQIKAYDWRDQVRIELGPIPMMGSKHESHEPSPQEYLLMACEAVLECPTLRDENGHAYLKVDARSLLGTAAFVADAVRKAKAAGINA